MSERSPADVERAVTASEIKTLDYALRYSTISHDYGCESRYEFGSCTCPAQRYRDGSIALLRRLSAGLKKPSGDYVEAVR